MWPLKRCHMHVNQPHLGRHVGNHLRPKVIPNSLLDPLLFDNIEPTSPLNKLICVVSGLLETEKRCHVQCIKLISNGLVQTTSLSKNAKMR
ncbi:hypothetical protein XA68_10453 [Ophiocordyceps unilateralis]|uniref:Uncharacterized protein n=1 Tax=Ophiocordyceps unilateralis TaxID=268505 RepID=A0A2A9PGX2_OPHUN|nr:hypothetical protein XA68_10453 [Ophiocordyceps unilateralis]